MSKPAFIFLVIFLNLFPVVEGSQPNSADESENNRQTILEMTDEVVGEGMRRLRVPGAVVVVVKDGTVLLSKGYGFADLESKQPVSTDKTLFRVASISKLFTAVAVLQLHERGLLDVTAPIGPHLDGIELSLGYPEPITFHHLLTHTAGFDMTDIGDAARKPEDIVSLRELVSHGMTPQVLPPGRFYSYSNHGFVLAGYLVSRLSRQRFEQYMQTEILDPLGMTRSTFEQPIPAGTDGTLATGYAWGRLSRDYSNIVPADGLVATGDEVGLFMLALLNGGSLNGQSILKPKTVDMMFQQQFTAAGDREGMAYGFHEEIRAGRRALEHSGAQLGFLTLLQLVPEENLGIFITHNSRDISGRFRNRVSRELLDHLIKTDESEAGTPYSTRSSGKRNRRYAGTYRQVSYPHSTYEKLMTLFGSFSREVHVKYAGDGILMIQDRPYVEVKERLFSQSDGKGERRYGFQEGESGQVTHLVSGRQAYERIPWYKTDNFRYPVFQVCLVILLLQTLITPTRALWFKSRKKIPDNSSETIAVRVVHSIQYWAGTCFILFFAGLMIHFKTHGDQLSDYGVPLSFKAVLFLSTSGAILALFLPVTTAIAWREEHGTLHGRLVQTVANAATVIFSIHMLAHNLVGWHF